MTTTSTRPAKAPTDPLDELREARAQLDSARAENARLRERRDNYAGKLCAAQQELDTLAASRPSEFGDDGAPKRGSRAAKLRTEIDAAGKSRWLSVVEGSDARVQEAEGRLRRLTARHGVLLARQAHDAGVAAIQNVRSRASELRAALAAVRAPEHDLRWIATAAAGAIDGRSTWSDARVAELERALDAADHMLPARIPVMTPYVGEEPTVSLAGDGSWVDIRSEPKSGWAEQPEPIEPPA